MCTGLNLVKLFRLRRDERLDLERFPKEANRKGFTNRPKQLIVLPLKTGGNDGLFERSSGASDPCS
jgi:hypothetical protein